MQFTRAAIYFEEKKKKNNLCWSRSDQVNTPACNLNGVHNVEQKF